MITQLLIYSGFAGITVFIGGLLANFFNRHVKDTPAKPIIIHSIMAFGSGMILSAVALVLVPKQVIEAAYRSQEIGGPVVFE